MLENPVSSVDLTPTSVMDFFSHWCWNNLRFLPHPPDNVLISIESRHLCPSWESNFLKHSPQPLFSLLRARVSVCSLAICSYQWLPTVGRSLVVLFLRRPPAPAELQNRFSIPEFSCPLYSSDSHSHNFYSGNYCLLFIVCVLGARTYECYRWASTQECRWKPKIGQMPVSVLC